MITIKGFLHRDQMCDVIRRWMYCDTRPDDADLVVKLVYFNRVFISRYLDIFAHRLFSKLHSGNVYYKRVNTKGGLKDAIIAQPPYRNERIDTLIARYQSNPWRFYRETPFHGTIYFKDDGDKTIYLGSSRIKRARRLAEKSARRIIDQMFERIKKKADALATERAKFLGIPREQLMTPPAQMEEEFFLAESQLLDDLREKRPIAGDGEIPPINDVAGIKVILEAPEENRLMDVISSLNDSEIVEEQRHSGRYNATNLIIRFRPPRDEIFFLPLEENVISSLQDRGYSPYESNQAFRDFVLSGEEDVFLEIILSSYQEMLESEIGISMHEDRILEQRLKQLYRGPLAKNIGYLMEYLFAFPNGNKRELGNLPVKLWNRYLPDYFDEVLKELFQIPVGDPLN